MYFYPMSLYPVEDCYFSISAIYNYPVFGILPWSGSKMTRQQQFILYMLYSQIEKDRS